jgi:polyhydroxybutyrate depolymerase
MKGLPLAAPAVFFLVFFLQTPEVSLLQNGEVTVDSLQRTFVFHLPTESTPHPGVLFVIHGSQMSAREMRYVTGRQFERGHGVIAVYPQGYHGYWNDCRKRATYDAKTKGIDDIAFFKKMIAWFAEKYAIDTTHVFATGLSNGGHMVYKLGLEMPASFKGLAAISASMPVETNDDCTDTHKPVSMLVMNGTADPLSPYTGGEFTSLDTMHRGAVLSTDATITHWLETDGCDTASRSEYHFPDLDPSDSSTVVSYTYSSLTTGRKVELLKIINGGHLVPNSGFDRWPKAVGNVNRDINSPVIILDFFAGLDSTAGRK